MELTEHERIFIQNQGAPNFPTYLKSVWYIWPTLKYNHVRRKASKLWKARKAWLETLEPTPARLKKKCETCHSSFHQIWVPLLPIVEETSVLTVNHLEDIIESELDQSVEGQKNDVLCRGCKENHPNQLGHMDYGGCLYYDACDMGLADPFDAISTLQSLPVLLYSSD